ncbi:MAG: hypothetical protein ACMXYL_02195 [Candidatus Woesearchaeota archaeon]
MQTQALERMLQNVSVAEMDSTRLYPSIDLYAIGTTHFYTGDPQNPNGPGIAPIGGPGSPSGVVDTPDYLGGGTERFRRPEYDSVHGDHMNYEQTIPGIKRPIINIHIPMDRD